MAILIVNLKKFSSSQKRNIKRFYSCLEFNYKQHSEKKLTEIGNADVILFQLDLSVFFSIGNNKLFKYLQEQDLSSFKVCFIYERTKYKQVFNKSVRWFCRRLPLLTCKNIEDTLDVQADHDEETKSRAQSLTAEEFADILIDPIKPEPTKPETKIPEDLDEKIAEMESLLDFMRGLRDGAKAPTPLAMSGCPLTAEQCRGGLEKPVLKRHSATKSGIPYFSKAQPPPPKTLFDRGQPVKKKKVLTEKGKFKVVQGSKVLKEFPFNNPISRRKARKQALLFSQS